jgi:hypothetical protein
MIKRQKKRASDFERAHLTAYVSFGAKFMITDMNGLLIRIGLVMGDEFMNVF